MLLDKTVLALMRKDINFAVRSLSDAIDLYRDASPIIIDERYRRHAYMHCMATGYTSIESAIKRLFSLTGEHLPVGQSLPADLLEKAGLEVSDVRRPVFSDTLLQDLRILKSFRQVAHHKYEHYQPELNRDDFEAAQRVAISLLDEVESTIRQMQSR